MTLSLIVRRRLSHAWRPTRPKKRHVTRGGRQVGLIRRFVSSMRRHGSVKRRLLCIVWRSIPFVGRRPFVTRRHPGLRKRPTKKTDGHLTLDRRHPKMTWRLKLDYCPLPSGAPSVLEHRASSTRPSDAVTAPTRPMSNT
jgi:hypothetical protein